MAKVTHIISGLGDGGAERALYRLCKNDETNELTVISLTKSRKYIEELKGSGINTITLDFNDKPIHSAFMLCMTLRKCRPAYVFTWMVHADLIGGIAAKITTESKIAWGIRSSRQSLNTYKLTTIFATRFCAIASWFIPDKIICCSLDGLEYAKSLGYHKNKLTFIANGYDEKELFPESESLKREYKIKLVKDEDYFLFGMVARLNPQKDHSNLFKAVQILMSSQSRDFRVLLVGNGLESTNKELRSKLIELGILNKIILLGPQNNIKAIMNALDVHVLSSATEAFPNVLAEAMLCETPCISTDVGDARIIIGNTGLVVPSQSPRLLAEAMRTALEMRQAELSKLGKDARARIVKNYSIAKMLQKFMEI